MNIRPNNDKAPGNSPPVENNPSTPFPAQIVSVGSTSENPGSSQDQAPSYPGGARPKTGCWEMLTAICSQPKAVNNEEPTAITTQPGSVNPPNEQASTEHPPVVTSQPQASLSPSDEQALVQTVIATLESAQRNGTNPAQALAELAAVEPLLRLEMMPVNYDGGPLVELNEKNIEAYVRNAAVVQDESKAVSWKDAIECMCWYFLPKSYKSLCDSQTPCCEPKKDWEQFKHRFCTTEGRAGVPGSYFLFNGGALGCFCCSLFAAATNLPVLAAGASNWKVLLGVGGGEVCLGGLCCGLFWRYLADRSVETVVEQNKKAIVSEKTAKVKALKEDDTEKKGRLNSGVKKAGGQKQAEKMALGGRLKFGVKASQAEGSDIKSGLAKCESKAEKSRFLQQEGLKFLKGLQAESESSSEDEDETQPQGNNNEG